MGILYAVTTVLLLVSFLFHRQKTLQALKSSARMFLNLLPSLLSILILVSLGLTALGPESIQAWLGRDSGLLGFVLAAITGAISLIPGFLAYPLAAVLVQNGVTYPVISVFITTLMMVGLLTLPLEQRFFGWRVAIARNSLAFVGAVVIGGLMSLVWGLL